MKHALFFFSLATLLAVIGLVAPLGALGSDNGKAPKASQKELVTRGKYLVTIGNCGDCHSPKVFGPMGPMPDTTKLLSGSPADAPIPPLPAGVLAPDKWGAVTSNDMTIWRGPWGVSFTRNLTPDTATGLGSWSEEMFAKTLRTGKHMGEGRDLLPPMPWQGLSALSDYDVRAIYTYLRTITPVHNAVRDPLPPTP